MYFYKEILNDMGYDPQSNIEYRLVLENIIGVCIWAF